MTDDDRYSKFQMTAMGMLWISAAKVAELSLAELIKCRGGTGPWLDDLQAKAIRGLKNSITEGVGISDEVQMFDAAIFLANAIFNTARKDFDGDAAG
jgi:hypothetical protein